MYNYFWDHAPPGQDQGAYHESEINYVLNNLFDTDKPWVAADYAIAEKMNGYWANFVKTQNPNTGDGYEGPGRLEKWGQHMKDKAVVMNVGDSWRGIDVASKEQIELIREFFDTQKVY